MKNKLLKEILSIVFLSLFLGLTYNYFSPKGIPLLRKEPIKTAVLDLALFGSETTTADTLKKDTQQNESDLKIVSLEQVKRLLNEGRALLIDARNADEFAKGRIPGAINIPYMEVEHYFEKLLELPTDTLIVIYCNNPECPLGHSLMKFMEQMEFKKLYLYDEGWDGWNNAGMPIEKEG